MINLPVDEAYAFDYLSILVAKGKLAEAEHLECSKSIIKQIGHFLFCDILCSDEYRKLININEKIFQTIDKLRDGEKIDARFIDKLNIKRWKTKKELQKKFFNRGIIEVKTKI